MKNHEFLLQAFNLVRDMDIFPGTSIANWVKDLLYLHHKGFLYGSIDENDKVKLVTCCYKVKEVPTKPPEAYPDKSEGTILYVAWVASKENDSLMLRRMVKSFLDQDEEVDTLCFHDLEKGEELKIFHRLKKDSLKEGDANGKQKETILTSGSTDT